MRLNSGITSAVAAIVTASLAEPAVPPAQIALIVMVVLALSNGGYALNDVYDRHIDQINQPGRPLPSGRIGPAQGFLIGTGNLLVAVGLSVSLTGWCLMLTLLDAGLLMTYAIWSKDMGVWKTIIVGYLVASVFLIGAYTSDRIDLVIGTLIACAFFATIARELVKDVQDLAGDRRCGARTVPILFGSRAAYGSAFFCLGICVLLATVPYVTGLVGHVFMALIGLAVSMFMIGWQLRHASAQLCQYLIMAASIVVLIAYATGPI
jgi:geranylgeranylglycerol-phosphate geranylgeranyltransferase